MSVPPPQTPPLGSPTPAPPTPAPLTPPRPRTALDRRAVVLSALGLVLTVLVGLVLLLPDDDGTAGAAATPPPDVAVQPSTEPTPSDTAAQTPAADEPSAAEIQAQLDAISAEIVRRDPTDPTAQGAADAPVVMVVWADFRCGYCGQFAVETAPGLADYVADGTLRVEWRDYPVVTEQSPAIAAAARAAGLQGRFWEYHDRVFADQAAVEVMGDEYLRAVAADLGLDVAQFDAARVSTEVLSAVQADAAEGQALGVRATPTFLVNGSLINGSQPLETFVAVIEAELARVGG